MEAFEVYTDERCDGAFTESLLVSVTVLALDEKEALDIVLERYGKNMYFTCKDEDLKVRAVQGLILSVSYNG